MAKSKKVGYAAYRLSPLKKITDQAKRIRKAHPNMKWTDAVAKAGKQYKSGKVSAVPKPAAHKKSAHKKAAAPKKVARKKVAHKKTPAVKQGALFGRVGNYSMEAINNITKLQKELQEAEKNGVRLHTNWKAAKLRSDKIYWRSGLDHNKRYVKTLKQQIQAMKKHIK